jgi:hypothetical protein
VARAYPAEAIEKCFRLYLRFNGGQWDRIEKEMRREWPGWSKQNLGNRGDKLGWIEKYGWEAGLKLHLATKPAGARTSAETLFNEIEETRKKLFADLQALGGRQDRDLVYQYRDFCKLSIEALSKVQGAGNTLESFVAFWERLLDMLPEISEKAAAALLAVADQVIERAGAEYAHSETNRSNGTD